MFLISNSMNSNVFDILIKISESLSTLEPNKILTLLLCRRSGGSERRGKISA